MRCSFGSAILVIACFGSTAHAQRMMFPDDPSTTRRAAAYARFVRQAPTLTTLALLYSPLASRTGMFGVAILGLLVIIGVAKWRGYRGGK